MVEPANVTIWVDEDGTRGVMAVGGDLDMACELELLSDAAALLEIDTVQRLVVDLAQVTFLDSYGLGVLIKLYGMAQDSGRGISLLNPSRIAAAVVKIAAIDELFS